jgi:hypothetical protein
LRALRAAEQEIEKPLGGGELRHCHRCDNQQDGGDQPRPM